MAVRTAYQNYLARNRLSYCFRVRVPADLQPIIGKTELRYSLQTGYLRLAKSRVMLFQHVRCNVERSSEEIETANREIRLIFSSRFFILRLRVKIK